MNIKEFLIHEGIEGSANINLIYNFLNNKYFGRRLPKIQIKWNSMNKSVGIAKVKYIISKNNMLIQEVDKSTLEIQISKKFEHDLRSLQAVLLHEMVHILMYLKNNVGKHHGTPMFDGEIKRLIDESGLNVPYLETSLDISSKIKPKEGLILVIKKPNYFGYSVYNKNFFNKNGENFTSMLCRTVPMNDIIFAEMYKINSILISSSIPNRRLTGITTIKFSEDEAEDIRSKGEKLMDVGKGGGWCKIGSDRIKFNSSGLKI